MLKELEMMLMSTDPFRELDRLTQQVFGTAARPAAMPMDAWQEDGEFVVPFDLPGVDVDSVDLSIEKNVLTVRAERRDPTQPNVELVVGERPRGVPVRRVQGDQPPLLRVTPVPLGTGPWAGS
jgi:HSP20 family protein